MKIENRRCKHDAKSIVDACFDKKILADGITRDQMNVLQELIEFMMNNSVESHIRAEKLMENINKSKTH